MTETKKQNIQHMDEEIARLEAERAELERPPQEIGWDELVAKSAKYERELEARERRRGILPRLITAAKIKRLELQREQWEREIGPLEAERDAAYERIEAAEATLREARKEKGLAEGVWSDARWRIQSRRDRIQAIDREIRELKGETAPEKPPATPPEEFVPDLEKIEQIKQTFKTSSVGGEG